MVESGFGSLAPFNALIRSIFIDARATNLESLVVASSEDTALDIMASQKSVVVPLPSNEGR